MSAPCSKRQCVSSNGDDSLKTAKNSKTESKTSLTLGTPDKLWYIIFELLSGSNVKCFRPLFMTNKQFYRCSKHVIDNDKILFCKRLGLQHDIDVDKYHVKNIIQQLGGLSKQLIEDIINKEKMIREALNDKQCADYIVQTLVKIKVQGSSGTNDSTSSTQNCCVSIECPLTPMAESSDVQRRKRWQRSVNHLKLEKLIDPAKYDYEKLFFADKEDYDRRNYYKDFFSKEILEIVFKSDKIANNLSFMNDQHEASKKNILLLDWDDTLFFTRGNRIMERPYLIEFLKFVCKNFNVFVNTAGFNKVGRISKLNKRINENENEPIGYILGEINGNDHKWMMNKWMRKYNWLSCQTKEFLLLDDHCCGIDNNILKIPAFGDTILYSRQSGQRKGLEDDQSLKQLIPILEEWNQYTNIDKKGNTRQFLKIGKELKELGWFRRQHNIAQWHPFDERYYY